MQLYAVTHTTRKKSGAHKIRVIRADRTAPRRAAPHKKCVKNIERLLQRALTQTAHTLVGNLHLLGVEVTHAIMAPEVDVTILIQEIQNRPIYDTSKAEYHDISISIASTSLQLCRQNDRRCASCALSL